MCVWGVVEDSNGGVWGGCYLEYFATSWMAVDKTKSARAREPNRSMITGVRTNDLIPMINGNGKGLMAMINVND